MIRPDLRVMPPLTSAASSSDSCFGQGRSSIGQSRGHCHSWADRKYTRSPPRTRSDARPLRRNAGELFPRLGFIVTNLETPSRAVVRFYNKRGTAEQWIKEGKQAVKMTRLSCHRFRSNQVRVALSLLAYNLGNLWRRLALPRPIEKYSMTSLQQRLVKTGGRLVKHARYYWLLLAEGHLNRRRFGAMLGRIELLPVPAG